MYLFGLDSNLRVEAGLKRVSALCVSLFALRLVLTRDRPVVTERHLEVVIRKGRVAVFEGVLKCRGLGPITYSMYIYIHTHTVD